MKRLLYFVFVGIVLSGSCNISAVQNADSRSLLQISLKTDKRHYKLGEPIWITVAVKNVGDAPIYVYAFLDGVQSREGGLSIRIRGPHAVQRVGIVDDPTSSLPAAVPKKFVLLSPGYFIGNSISLTPLPKVPGKYSLVVEYDSAKYVTAEERSAAAREFPYQVASGMFTSPAVLIDVTK